MYLSRLKFDPQSHQVSKIFADRHELHRTLCAQFDSLKRVEFGLLYRIETSDPYQVEPIILLAQTQVEPCWNKLAEMGLLFGPPEVKQFEPRFTTGELFHFRLLANPTVRKKEGEFAGKRVGLLKEEEQEAWFRRKSEICGFSVGDLQLVGMGNVFGSKVINGKRVTLTHLAVLYEGLLKVADEDLFSKAVKQGVGTAKAFGFGLLSLAKA